MVDIREYRNGDEVGILSLFEQVFNADRDRDYWHWQFMENPASPPIIVVAEEQSNIVGQCTLLPSYMNVKGEKVFSGQSIDTMVNEEYRGQGLHIEMANKSYEIGVEKGIKFRIGFPSQMALRGLLGSLGGTLVTEIPIYMRPYRTENFLLSILKSKVIAKILSIPLGGIVNYMYKESKIKVQENYVLKEIEEFSEDFDGLWDRIKSGGQIMTKRDREFLNWRIKNHPKISYKKFAAYLGEELVGYVILKVEPRRLKGRYEVKLGSIVDLIGVNEDVIAALYYRAKEYFKEENVDFVATWISATMKYRDLFIKLGFIKSKSTIPFVVRDLTENKMLEESIADEKNWYLMPIESDFY